MRLDLAAALSVSAESKHKVSVERGKAMKKIISFLVFYKDSYKKILIFVRVIKHYSHEKIRMDYRFDILHNLHHTSQRQSDRASSFSCMEFQ